MYKIIAIVGALIISHGVVGYAMYKSGGDAVRADAAVEAQKAVKKARKEEQDKQEKVNEFAQKQFDDLSANNDVLTADLDRLRNRPDRRRLPDSPETICQGANGADLSKPDAEFLTREAARADTLRIALKACYDYADTVIQ